MKSIVLLSPRGYCAGVERAIKVVDIALKKYGAPIYVRKQIVHNTHVVKWLEQRGAIFVNDIDDVPPNQYIVFSAHGVSPAVRSAAKLKKLQVFDATCPLVTKVHNEVIRYTKLGYLILLIGHKEHEEIEGTYGESPNSIIIIENIRDVNNLSLDLDKYNNKIIWLSQTTLSVDDTKSIVEALKNKYPMLKDPPTSDICYATQNRQDAIKNSINRWDILLVVGSTTSSNANRLVEIAQYYNKPSHLINDYVDINIEWLHNINRIGITSGASTPDIIIKNIIKYLSNYNYNVDYEYKDSIEDIIFRLPKEFNTR